MAQRTAQPGEVNYGALDFLTVVHFAAGYLAERLTSKLGFGRSLALAIAWEVAERPLKDRYPRMFPHPTQDTPINMATDTMAFVAGAAVARQREGKGW